MSDIARHAGVSQSTVSFVLNERDTALRISEETRMRVLQAADELGYRRNGLARAMRTGNTRMIGVAGGDISSEQVGQMVAGALEEAEAHGYTLKVLALREGSDRLREMIERSAELRLMGLIALHIPLPWIEQLREESKRARYPLLLLDVNVPVAGVAQVASDDLSGVKQAIEHLVQLGHRKIAFISGAEGSTLSPVRISFYCAAMEQNGLIVPSGYIQHGDFLEREPSVEAVRRLLLLPETQRPTAIVCAGDRIACVVLQEASRLGIDVPGELSVVGFADLAMARFCWPLLTTVAQPFHEMGRRAVTHLLKSGNEETNRETSVSSEEVSIELLPTHLVERASTAPPRS